MLWVELRALPMLGKLSHWYLKAESVCVCVVCFEILSHKIAVASVKLAIYIRLAWNSEG